MDSLKRLATFFVLEKLWFYLVVTLHLVFVVGYNASSASEEALIGLFWRTVFLQIPFEALMLGFASLLPRRTLPWTMVLAAPASLLLSTPLAGGGLDNVLRAFSIREGSVSGLGVYLLVSTLLALVFCRLLFPRQSADRTRA